MRADVLTNISQFITTLCFLVIAGLQGAQAEAHADAAARQRTVCAGCHGADGVSAAAEIPSIAGQSARYVVKQLADFKSGARQNAMMNPIAGGLSEADMADLGAFYAKQKRGQNFASQNLVKAGEKLYRGGNRDSGIPACMACHGPNGAGNGPAGVPALSSQHADYTKAQLQAYRTGARSNDKASVMRAIAARMTESEIESVASYAAGLY
jgi:cytochrome c553